MRHPILLIGTTDCTMEMEKMTLFTVERNLFELLFLEQLIRFSFSVLILDPAVRETLEDSSMALLERIPYKSRDVNEFFYR